MTKEEYEKLNKHLNDVSNYLEYNCSILINNMYNICEMNDGYYQTLCNYKFEKKNKENNLTYNDVYLLAREIIESINPSYLEEYDKLMDSGQLDFSYEWEYMDCEFVYKVKEGKSYKLININREFNYDDVINLVHEFIHYTNGKSEVTRNRDLLTEFLSIYFETYAIDYLINKGINKDEIDYEIRLKSTFYRTQLFYNIESPLLCFMNFGDINADNYEFFKNNIFNIDRDYFNQECNNLLERFEKIDKNYRNSHFSDEYDYNQVIKECAKIFIMHFKYLFGTILAIYAFKNCKMEDILYLNEHINDDNNADMVELLKNSGININDDNFLKNAFMCINEYLCKYANVKGDL